MYTHTTCTHRETYIHIGTHHTHVGTCACIHGTYTHVYICTHTHTHTYTPHVHIYIIIHIFTQIQIHTHSSPGQLTSLSTAGNRTRDNLTPGRACHTQLKEGNPQPPQRKVLLCDLLYDCKVGTCQWKLSIGWKNTSIMDLSGENVIHTNSSPTCKYISLC